MGVSEATRVEGKPKTVSTLGGEPGCGRPACRESLGPECRGARLRRARNAVVVAGQGARYARDCRRHDGQRQDDASEEHLRPNGGPVPCCLPGNSIENTLERSRSDGKRRSPWEWLRPLPSCGLRGEGCAVDP